MTDNSTLTTIQLNTIIAPKKKKDAPKSVEITLSFYTPTEKEKYHVQELSQLNTTEQDHDTMSKALQILSDVHGVKLHDGIDAEGDPIPAVTMHRHDGYRECVHYEKGMPKNAYGLAFFYILDENDCLVQSDLWDAGRKPNSEEVNRTLETYLTLGSNPQEKMSRILKRMDEFFQSKEQPKKDYLISDYKPKGYTL